MAEVKQKADADERKIDYNPPSWLVKKIDFAMQLTDEQAQKLHDLRTNMCEVHGKNNDICSLRFLFEKAFELLLLNEGPLLTKVEKI